MFLLWIKLSIPVAVISRSFHHPLLKKENACMLADTQHFCVFTFPFMLSHIVSFYRGHLFLGAPTKYPFNITCRMTTSEPSVCPLWLLCWHQKSTESCGQGVTYPSTGHGMSSLAALPWRPSPPRLSCYTSQADLTPRLDNSPFFNSIFLSKTLTRRSSLNLATGLRPSLNHWEESGLASLSSSPRDD